MWIKDVIDKIRKGVKAGMIAVKESNALTDARVVRLISEFEASPEREWMMTGERRCTTGEIISAAGENLIRHILLMNIS